MMKRFFLLLLAFCALEAYSQEITFPEIPGWIPDGKVLAFNKENLYEHIDGAAEFYLSYGFESLKVASWSNNGAELTIEVYDHADPLQAYGIYSIEKSEKAVTLPVGLEGYGDASTFNFVAGKYYVKMNGTQLEKVPGFSERSVAEGLSRTLCAKPGYPAIISLFPTQDMVPNTCQYIPTEFMGLSFLGSAVRARYRLGGEEITLFLVERPERSDIEKIVRKYADYSETKIKVSEGDLTMKDPFNGTVFLRWKGNRLAGATGSADRRKIADLLGRIGAKL